MSVRAISLSSRYRRWVAAWREAAARRRGLDSDATERSLRAGMSSVDFRLARVGVRAEFEPMAQHFGVDLTRVPPRFLTLLRDAERTCALCQDVRRCRRWLAQEARSDAPRLFCANAPVFDEIAPDDVNWHSSGAARSQSCTRPASGSRPITTGCRPSRVR